MAIATHNPATGQTERTFEPLDEAGIEERVARAAAAFRVYRRTRPAARAAWLLRAAELLEERAVGLGQLMALEMGKLARAGAEEAAKCARVCRFYAEHGERLLAPREVPTDARRSTVRFDPLGPVLAIMPWNFPFWQVFRFAAPALAAGNVGLLKHASNVPQCALLIEQILREAGFPEGVFQALLIESGQVARVIADSRVAAVTLTGSEGAGAQVAREAGGHLKKTVLELGGSDPFIVMPSADVAEAARVAARARCINSGQSCIAAKRFIVHEAVARAFKRRFVAHMTELILGDPRDPATEVGPLASEALLETLERQVRETVEAGARVLTGGARAGRAGYYYVPTVLVDVPRDSPAAREELFGPVAALFVVRDVDEAIDLANDTRFGLASSVWTRDEGERARFVEELEAGLVFVNAMVASDPRLPFGGVSAPATGVSSPSRGCESS